ncbi:hypothetical protein [Geminocystis sp. NIES-3709]|uniref:hypothetical protein n=1 Tax=Geminocystis sp. NIES-3709 TaxID=1617448 RepID=UPI0005FC9816|nr:hypothetical protein [Geminocystis sp. NIES-3709]BAQ66391.1 hypothetical protein GM3709_3156 [Geminocystis sp. NIES-3709]
MSFFKPQQPILQKKQLSFNSQQLISLRCLRVKFLEFIHLSGIYTCIDQAMMIWGVVAGIIFMGAQFLSINWTDQAIFWSIITLIAIIIMINLTHSWTMVEKIAWLLYGWVALMVIGIIITDCSIVYHWGIILSHLCHLWLILSTIGYGLTAWGMRSRAFVIATIVHGISIGFLPWFSSYQFAITGLIMMSNLLIFAEGQWDMLLPRELREYLPQTINNTSHITGVRNHDSLVRIKTFVTNNM